MLSGCFSEMLSSVSFPLPFRPGKILSVKEEEPASVGLVRGRIVASIDEMRPEEKKSGSVSCKMYMALPINQVTTLGSIRSL